ncbi:hypothetical protein BE21_19130 [Sorangium cellulosum]|uniref:MalT-like TPR region domain-containing protein n=1 Tax=Sorangium cellulosum TaxID=56 RepID=A0A150TX07_SORCE|nr:hypothetical protein BE21_19130 [Sorangium cellulosum]
MKLVVDVEAGRVLLGSMALRDQWVDFYAILAIARCTPSSSQSFVGAESVGRTGPWRHKTTASVGKEIARHLAWLDAHSLGSILAIRGKTRAWRLNLRPQAISLSPDEATVRAWVESRSAKPVAEHAWVDELRTLVEATVALHQGRAEAVLGELARPLSAGAEPALRAWEALVRGRAAFQQDNDDLLVQLHDDWFKRADGPSKTVSAKLRALVAFRNRFDEPELVLRTLSRLAAELELRGDTAALGAVLNVTGMLLRRTGDPEGATVHHLRAAGLLGIVGDYPSLEGTLFNLANCRREALQKQNLPLDDAVFALVELSRLVCKHFTIGRDSAQSEIAAAQWALEDGDAARARRYLDSAEAIVKGAESTYDQACFHFARARIEHAFPSGRSDPVRDLRVAERLLEEVGDSPALAETRRLLKQLTSAQRGKRSR